MYRIIFQKPAEAFFRKLQKPEQKQIAVKIEHLKQNPELGKPLTGRLAGIWCLRIGSYRALYVIHRNELIILVLTIGHRKNVYDT